MPNDLRPKGTADVANGFRVDGLDVKHYGTTRYRTSATANGGSGRTARSNRAGNTEFFRNLRPCDGPRRPPIPRLLPSAGALARGNDAIVPGGVPSPVRSPDTAAPHATSTSAVPPHGTSPHNSAPKDEPARTSSHTPSEGRSAHGNGRGLAIALKSHHAEPRPREPHSRRSSLGAAYSAPRHLKSISPRKPHRFSLTTTPSCCQHPTRPPLTAIDRIAAWPPGPARSAPSCTATHI